MSYIWQIILCHLFIVCLNEKIITNEFINESFTRSVRYVVSRSIRHDANGCVNFFRIVSRLLTGTVRLGSNQRKWMNDNLCWNSLFTCSNNIRIFFIMINFRFPWNSCCKCTHWLGTSFCSNPTQTGSFIHINKI